MVGITKERGGEFLMYENGKLFAEYLSLNKTSLNKSVSGNKVSLNSVSNYCKVALMNKSGFH